jgi:WS/DGAT/MGAT family acyltransferase
MRGSGLEAREALDRLTAEDARILKLEHGVIRGHTCKVLVLEGFGGRPLPTLDALRAHVGARVGSAPRLRKRVVATPLRVANPVWLDDPDFDVAHHVLPVETGASVSREQLEQIVARLMTQSLDRSRPLWRMDVVERMDDGSMALIWRIHHCLADGTASVRLGSAVLWSDGPDEVSPPVSSWTPEAGPGELGLFARGLASHVHRAPGDRRSRPRPFALLTSRALVKRELGRRAVPTSLAHRVGFTRSVAFAMAPLEQCRRAGKAIGAGVTLNDVVLALVAGGVRAWAEGDGGPTEGIRVKIPVSLHVPDERDEAANRDSYFFVDLPVGEADIAMRVLAINRETQERKLDHDAEGLDRLARHPFVTHRAMSARVFTFNVSNVRGPANDVYVAGARVRQMYSLAEIARHHALRVAVISASGWLFFGLCADRDAIGDLHLLSDGIGRATDELLSAAG